MKQVDRERITAALMGEVPGDFPALCKDLEELCADELRRIEPIIDEIVDRERGEAWKQGIVHAPLHVTARTH